MITIAMTSSSYLGKWNVFQTLFHSKHFPWVIHSYAFCSLVSNCFPHSWWLPWEQGPCTSCPCHDWTPEPRILYSSWWYSPGHNLVRNIKPFRNLYFIELKELVLTKVQWFSSSASVFYRSRNWVQKSEVTYLRLHYCRRVHFSKFIHVCSAAFSLGPRAQTVSDTW